MKKEDLIFKAKEDLKALKKIVLGHNGTLEELYSKLNGFGLNKTAFFDVAFNNITATIYFNYETKKVDVCEDIKVWDEENCENVELEDLENETL